ncbi:MAG TPA: nitrate reductase subunit alpha [Bryobacteraceae bacterium]|nr:nitrate reductase subunit alpha [Bryobacteraceae bacterium]
MSWIKDIVNPKMRLWEEFYRNRWQHDKVVRSTHGVNCTGGCSWMIYVKNGIVTWEMQALDYPRLENSLPLYEPRGCQRGIVYSWYVYSPLRIKYPYLRGVLMEFWEAARARHADPVEAWASIVEDEEKRHAFQVARGKGGFRRANWDQCLEIIAASMLYTAKKYGPDRVIGFSPIPAMSMLSYAAGSRFLQLFGGVMLSFYDMYADFPPASPETWGEKTDVAESADWFNSKYIVASGSNLNMTRTPDAHFVVEARHHGAKLVVLSPDFSQVSKHADWWIPVNAGMDGAMWMAVNHVILKEFHVDRQVPYFTDYLKRYSDTPFLIEIEKTADGYAAGRFLRANRIERYRGVENGDWKLLVLDGKSGVPKMPQGSIGFRWQEQPGQWNLELKDGLDGSEIDPQLSLLSSQEDVLQVSFLDFGGGRTFRRGVPVRYIETTTGRVAVTTGLDLLMAQHGVPRGLAGEYPESYDADEFAYTPAWQEKFTGVGRNTIVQLAREFAITAEKTRGKCTVIVGSGVNHWYHNNLHYRASITSLILCGCVGVNGGGLNHYTGQEKITPMASWSTIAMALDWVRPPRLQNGPSFHYVHSDQWHYESAHADYHPSEGRFSRQHFMDLQADAVRMGWLPFYPQFNRNPAQLVREAEQAGADTPDKISQWMVDQLRTGKTHFSIDDPDLPENWPRVWLIWRGNAIHSSAKGQEYFFRHYLGTHSNAIAEDEARETVQEVAWRETSNRGKMDLVVDLNFRMDTSALYSDIVLPSASWYEKDDLNTTDLHSYFHPLGAAVPPCWESRTDWDIFRSLAEKLSALAPAHFPEPFRDLVATPLLHDTPDEIAQPEVRDWSKGECEPVPGKTMPRFSIVERDYVNLADQFQSLGPLLKLHGVEDHGIDMPVADLYDEFAKMVPSHEWNGEKYPSIAEARDAANAVLFFTPEANGEIAWRGFKERERQVGLPLADLAEGHRGVRYDFADLSRQPRRILTSPCWSGILNHGRAYSGYVQNIERLIPWRTLTGRQHLYLDHEAYRAFGESCPTFKPRIPLENTGNLIQSKPLGKAITLTCITPHGKWHIHSTYYDNLRMLTLSRGVEPFWLNDKDADEIGVLDNDWVEAYNDNGVIVTRAVVSARVPRGICIFYHAPERTISFPKSPIRGRRRGGGTNSITRMRLKPLLMAGGYAQNSYRFNDYGPPATDRDTYVIVHKLEGKPQWD